jgi:hypothetical protein
MTSLEYMLQTLETRPATVDSPEQLRRTALFQHLSAINRFEGLAPSAVDERLFQLFAAGRISKQEYMDLCVADARGAA